MKRITKKAGPYADRIDWEAVRKAVREHRGYPVAVLDTKGAKGQHVADEMEEKLKSVEAADKAVVEKRRAAVKAERDAAAAEKAKNDVYAGDRKKKAGKQAVKEITIITKTESGPRTLNQ
jgi:hypothetical protein